MNKILTALAIPLLAGALTAPVAAHGENAERPGAHSAEEWRSDVEAFMAVLRTKHDDPFYHTSQAAMEAALESYFLALPAMGRAQRIAGFARIVAMVGDGHTWMPMHKLPFEGMPVGPAFRSLPVRFELFDDGLFIVGAVPEHANLLGGQVTRFGDVPTGIAVARTLELLPSDAQNFASEMVPEWLMQTELLALLGLAQSAEGVALTVLTEGEVAAVKLAPLPSSSHYDWIFTMDSGPSGDLGWHSAAVSIPIWREPVTEPFVLRRLDNAAYLRIDQIGNGSSQSLKQMADSAVAAALELERPAIVIDLRRCLGGDGTLNSGVVDAIVKSPALLQRGRIAVLTSRMSHSAAVMLVSALEQRTPAVFFGQPTADRPNHHGETNIFVTPNTGLPIIHASEYYQTSAPDDTRPFRSPDVPIPYLFSDYRDGTDPVLSAALADFEG